MPIFGRRKKRKAEEAATRSLKDSATAERPKYSMPGYGNRDTSGEVKGNQTPITLGKKKVTSIKGPTQKPQELKKRTIAEPPKPRLSLYQKDQLAKKNKTGKYAVKATSTASKTTTKSSVEPRHGDTRSKEQIATGNKRAIANRKAKGAAKPGDIYTVTKADGTTSRIKKT